MRFSLRSRGLTGHVELPKGGEREIRKRLKRRKEMNDENQDTENHLINNQEGENNSEQVNKENETEKTSQESQDSEKKHSGSEDEEVPEKTDNNDTVVGVQEDKEKSMQL